MHILVSLELHCLPINRLAAVLNARSKLVISYVKQGKIQDLQKEGPSVKIG